MTDRTPETIIDDWFSINKDQSPDKRPHSLRDVCFIHELNDGRKEVVKVNELEQKVMLTLRQAWLSYREGGNLWRSHI